MCNIVILDAATLGADIDLSPITSCGNATVFGATAPGEIAARVVNADVVVVNKIKMNADTIDGAKYLKLICVTATGFDNVDVAYCRARGIALCNVPAYSTDSVANLTLAMALSLVTHLTAYRDFVHNGKYAASGVANCLTPTFHELSALIWGVVGGGAIGRRVARLAAAFDCRVLMCRRGEEREFERTDIDTLCEKADIISLHVPLTGETRHMIDARRLGMMKKGAVLVNVARGAVCDESALVEAVESGQIGGLGVDVFEKEPLPAGHPYERIMTRANVCFTPHMAWGSVEARARCVATIARNIVCFFESKPQNRII